jgi:AraC family transcriptional regulator
MATAPRTSAAGDTSPGSKLRRVIERIRAHLDQDLALAHLGAVVSMSPYHFARRFQHSTGLSPHRFVVCERIDRAVRLQAAPALSIAHISQVVGFCTPSHFSTVFRRITGVSPSAYRPVAARGRSEESGGRDGIA